jgi:hypothetical protein
LSVKIAFHQQVRMLVVSQSPTNFQSRLSKMQEEAEERFERNASEE